MCRASDVTLWCLIGRECSVSDGVCPASGVTLWRLTGHELSLSGVFVVPRLQCWGVSRVMQVLCSARPPFSCYTGPSVHKLSSCGCGLSWFVAHGSRSLTGDQTHLPALEVQTLHHCTAGMSLVFGFLKGALSGY